MKFVKIRSLVTRINAYQVPIYAGNATFFIVLAVFPALMLILSLLQRTPLSTEDFISLLQELLPNALDPLVEYFTKDAFSLNTGAAISISAIAALWSASRGIIGLMDGINAIYHTEEKRSYFFKRLLALIYMIMFLIAIILMLGLYVFGQKIESAVLTRFPSLAGITIFLMQARYGLIIGYLILLFTMIFRVFPNKHMPFRYCLPGAVVSALGWLGFSALFSLYVEHFSNYSRVYGSLTTIVLAMLWLYFCMCILFFGGVINQFISRGETSLLPSLPRRKRKQAKTE